MKADKFHFQLLFGAIPFALGAFALLGALMFPAWLANKAPGFAYMGSTVAMCLVACGSSLLVAGNRGKFAQFLQAAAGATVLLQIAPKYYSEGRAWHDIFNAAFSPAGLNAAPKEICFVSVFGFLCAGLASMLLARRRGKAMAAALFLAVAVIGAVPICLLSAMLGNVLFDNRSAVGIQVFLPTALGLAATGAGLYFAVSRTGWFRVFYHEREDRRIFVTGIVLFTLISLVAGLIGIGIVGRAAVDNFENALWVSFRSNSELFSTSLHTSIARGGEIVRLSRLDEMARRRAGHADLQRELERVVQAANYEELSSLKVVDAGGKTLARAGADVFNGQFNVRLSLPEATQLYWHEGWRLLIRIPLNGGHGMHAVLDLSMRDFDSRYGSMHLRSATGETRVCAPEGEWMRCFPSRLSREPSRFPRSRSPAMTRALNGEQGVIGQLDYRGNKVIAAYGMMGATELVMVQKIDAYEFYQPLRRQLWYALGGLLLLILAGARVLYWRTRPLVIGLVRTRARLDAILNNVPAGVITVDADGLIASANRTAEKMFGYRAGQLLGVRFDRLLQGQERIAASGRVRELRALRRNGEEFQAEVIESRGMLGAQARRIAIIQDLTQRRAMESLLKRWDGMEQNLRQREEEFRALVENSPDMIIRFDRDLRFVYINPAVEKISRLQIARMIGKTFEGARLPSDIADVWTASIRKVFVEERAATFEFSFSTPSGERYYQVRLVPEFQQDGRALTVLAIARDITRIKAGEAVLRDSRQRLRELSAHMENVREEERKKIAREVHDELGQALTVLRMDVSLLRLNFGSQNPRLMERIQSMKEVVDRTIGIVRHVTSALRPAALNLGLNAALEWLVEDFSTHFEIHCVLHADEHDVALDDSQATALFRIAQESLNNVAKHAGANQVELTLEVEDELIRLEVRDNGMGFLPEAHGTAGAFGLMGMRERALILGGRVEIRSEVGAGTRVTATLPLKIKNMECNDSNSYR